MRRRGTGTDGPSFWAATRLVATREFVQRGRDKSFLISTLVTLLILAAVIALPRLLGSGDRPSYDVAFLGPDAAAVQAAARERADAVGVEIRAAQVEPTDARAQLADGGLDAAVDGSAVLVDAELDERLGIVLQDASRSVRGAQGLQAAGLDPGAVARAGTVEPLRVDYLDPPDPAQEARERVAFFGTFLLYFQIIGYGFWVALGVVEEKTSRVVEVILATVPSRALLAGKILGIGLLALLQLLLLAAGGLALAVAVDAVQVDTGVLPVVALVLGWFVLGYAFYACFFAAAAARVSSQEDLQNVTTPATLVLVASFFASFYVAANPDRPVSRVLAVVPPFSALVNPARMVGGEASLWQLALSVVLMLAAIAGLVLVAARLYEGAVLRMGGKVSLRDAWRGSGGQRSRPPRPPEPARRAG